VAVEQLHPQLGARVAAGVTVPHAPRDLFGREWAGALRWRNRRESDEQETAEGAHGRIM
jgi:hypothetical protein